MSDSHAGSFGERERPETEASSDAPEGTTPTGAEALDLERISRERDEYLALWQRAQADYQNQRRRAAGELESQVRMALEPLLEDLLLVSDHIDMALLSPATSPETKNLALGVDLVRQQLRALLDRAGVSPIPTEGAFDASRHQAVQSEPRSDLPPGTCVATIRRGYLWRGRPLRFAQVKVSTQPDSSAGVGQGNEAGARPGDQAAHTASPETPGGSPA